MFYSCIVEYILSLGFRSYRRRGELGHLKKFQDHDDEDKSHDDENMSHDDDNVNHDDENMSHDAENVSHNAENVSHNDENVNQCHEMHMNHNNGTTKFISVQEFQGMLQ